MRKLGKSVLFKSFVFMLTIVLAAGMLGSMAVAVSLGRDGYLPTAPFTQSTRLGQHLQLVTRNLETIDQQLAGKVAPDTVVELRQLPELAPTVNLALYGSLIESNLTVVYHNASSGILLTNADSATLQAAAPEPSAPAQLADRLINQLLTQPYAFFQDLNRDTVRPGARMTVERLPPQYRMRTSDEDQPGPVRLALSLDTAFEKPDVIRTLMETDARFRSWIIAALAALAACGILFLLAWAFLIRFAGWAGPETGVRLSWIDRVHGEFLLAGCGILLLMLGVGLRYAIPLVPEAIVFATVLYAIMGTLLLTMVRRYRAGILFSQTVMGSILLLIRRFYDNRPLFWKVVAAYAAFGFLALICAIELRQGGLRALLAAGALLLLPAAFFLLPLIRWAVQFQQVSQATEHMGLDTFRIDEPVERLHPDLRRMVASLASTHERMQRAIAEQMKSERLKTDLISNVSHDLKTPLTSIISYIDLLRQDQDDAEKRQAYLEILDQKAQRLKNLTESLFEAAKASSGSLPVQREPVNLNELVQQVSGEYADRLANRRLALVLESPDDPGARPEGVEQPKPIELVSDGAHIWRILDNLMANVCKYALDGTRVYVALSQDSRFARIELKNVSRERLERSGEELLQRFVRGDESRHEEGSGLGLSIASSLSGLLGGGLEIRTDGD